MASSDLKGDVCVLRPLGCLLPDSGKNAALVILNQPLEKGLLKKLWECSVFRAVTDGGTDCLLSCLGVERDKYIPDLITGDFDSTSEGALQFYSQHSVPKIDTPDQDETDFTKCLRITIEKTKSLPVEQFLVMGSFGGRVDQQFANFETLYKAAAWTNKPIYLLSEGNMACLLPSGKTEIRVDMEWTKEWCGLIPIGHRCDHVTTTGLWWNLDDQALAFGELVSTSNTYRADVVTVETDKPLLWSMGYKFPESS